MYISLGCMIIPENQWIHETLQGGQTSWQSAVTVCMQMVQRMKYVNLMATRDSEYICSMHTWARDLPKHTMTVFHKQEMHSSSHGVNIQASRLRALYHIDEAHMLRTCCMHKFTFSLGHVQPALLPCGTSFCCPWLPNCTQKGAKDSCGESLPASTCAQGSRIAFTGGVGIPSATGWSPMRVQVIPSVDVASPVFHFP